MEVIILSFLTFAVGVTVSFLHWCMGSPSGSEFVPGRIFSIWGRFVTSQYVKFDEKKQEKFRVFSNIQTGLLKAKLKDVPADQHNDITNEHFSILEAYLSDLDKRQKLNFWKAAGACLICFAFWASLVLWLFFGLAMGINMLLVLLGAPVSVWVAVRVSF